MRIEEVHLARRPDGVPAVEDFEIVGRESAEPRSGQIAVANRFFSIDPYMRGLMDDRPTYRAPFALHEVLDGPAVGEVVASTTDEIRIGDIVRHESGWRSHAVLDAADTSRVQPLDGVELSANLGVLGMPGFTAWLGLNVIGRFRPGQTVFVSSAAGAVGSLVGQLARLNGARRVIGSAGSPAKLFWLIDDLGFDAAFDHHDGPAVDHLRRLAPDGIDLYFDNVGGEQLEAALDVLRLFGRVVACGALSHYGLSEPPPGPRNLGLTVTKRLSIEGFMQMDHLERWDDFIREVSPDVAAGKIKHRSNVVEGIERAPYAFVRMLAEGKAGKTVVQV